VDDIAVVFKVRSIAHAVKLGGLIKVDCDPVLGPVEEHAVERNGLGAAILGLVIASKRADGVSEGAPDGGGERDDGFNLHGVAKV
jgi:hypothetical protein